MIGSPLKFQLEQIPSSPRFKLPRQTLLTISPLFAFFYLPPLVHTLSKALFALSLEESESGFGGRKCSMSDQFSFQFKG